MDFLGVKMAVTHFVTQFTHVSRHFGVENKKNVWKNCLENVFLDLPKKLLLQRSAKTKKTKNKKP